MGVFVRLNNVGLDVGSTATLYSDVDSYTTPFASNFPIIDLVDGYWFAGADINTETVKVVPDNDCETELFIQLLFRYDFVGVGITVTGTCVDGTVIYGSTETPGLGTILYTNFGNPITGYNYFNDGSVVWNLNSSTGEIGLPSVEQCPF